MAVKRLQHLNNESGMATLESIPIIVIFVMLVSYSLGLYGIIHSATLNSIGARAYAFETFRHRADLTYFRDRAGAEPLHNDTIGYRYHAVSLDEGNEFYAPRRPITVGKQPASLELQNQNVTNRTVHLQSIYELEARNQRVGVSEAWIMVGYGMCLDPACGAPEQ